MNSNKANIGIIDVNLDELQQDSDSIEASFQAIEKLSNKYKTYKYGPVFMCDDEQGSYESLEDAFVHARRKKELVSYIDEINALGSRVHHLAETLITLDCVLYRILECVREEVDSLSVKLNS